MLLRFILRLTGLLAWKARNYSEGVPVAASVYECWTESTALDGHNKCTAPTC